MFLLEISENNSKMPVSKRKSFTVQSHRNNISLHSGKYSFSSSNCNLSLGEISVRFSTKASVESIDYLVDTKREM